MIPRMASLPLQPREAVQALGRRVHTTRVWAFRSLGLKELRVYGLRTLGFMVQGVKELRVQDLRN